MIPALALVYLPLLLSTQEALWPDAPLPSFLAAQIEQESCVSLTHSKCWNPRAELKTSREYGFGFGQITRAYTVSGAVRFDKFSELKSAHASLRDWRWEERFDPQMQMVALLEMDKKIYGRVSGADELFMIDQLAFTLSAYNGGESGVKQDRLLCRNTDGCDPQQWFGHVALTSLKSKVKWQGYGESPYHINRSYVNNVIHVRRAKYVPYFGA